MSSTSSGPIRNVFGSATTVSVAAGAGAGVAAAGLTGALAGALLPAALVAGASAGAGACSWAKVTNGRRGAHPTSTTTTAVLNTDRPIISLPPSLAPPLPAADPNG